MQATRWRWDVSDSPFQARLKAAPRRAWQALRASLKLRLLAAFLLLALGLTFVFLLGMQKAVGVGWREAARPLVSDYVNRLSAELGSPPSLERAKELTQRLPISIRIEGPLVNWDSHPQRHAWSGGHRYRDAQEAAPLLERRTADGHRIEFGLGTLSWEDGPRHIGWITLGVLLLLILLAYVYLRHLLRPLQDIGAGAQRFAQGDFSAPITVRSRDELGQLASQVNTMGSEVHRMLEAKRALLLAVSHELRSPLTRARVHAELLSDLPEQAASRAALLQDLGEMSQLIGDLLESERLASRHAALQREPTDLVALVREQLGALAGGEQVRLTLSAEALPVLDLDRTRLRLLLRNLIDNARRHAAEAPQPTEVHLDADAQEVRLSVRDHGPGVAAEQMAQLAQPFFRTDASRQRATGGVGLGLYLCHLVAEAHGGRLVFSLADPGLQVTLHLPRPA